VTDDLRRAMQKAAGIGEPAVGDAFARFTAVKRRAAIARSAVVGVAAIAAATALFFTLPGLDSGDTGGNLPAGEATTPPNVRALKHYVDTIVGFELDYPPEWTIESEEGSFVRFLAPRDRLARSTATACDGCATADVFSISRVMLEIRVRGPEDPGQAIAPAELGWLRAAGAETFGAPQRDGSAVLQFGTRPALEKVREDVELRWWSAATVTTLLAEARTGPLRVETVVVDPRAADDLRADLEIMLRSIASL
jgi:hypothetical protein